MSLDSTAYERSVYTVWDWMGDVGGLYGTLAIIGHYIVTLRQSDAFGNTLQFLASCNWTTLLQVYFTPNLKAAYTYLSLVLKSLNLVAAMEKLKYGTYTWKFNLTSDY